MMLGAFLLVGLTAALSPDSACAAPRISKKSATMYVTGTKTLTVKGTSKKVTWSSSNKAVATVTSKGKVKAKKLGTATIKAKVGTKVLKCKITVKHAIEPNVSTLSIDKAGVTKTISVKVRAKGTIWYSISNSAVASCKWKGWDGDTNTLVVTSKNPGTATITFYTDPASEKRTVKLTVGEPESTL